MESECEFFDFMSTFQTFTFFVFLFTYDNLFYTTLAVTSLELVEITYLVGKHLGIHIADSPGFPDIKA